MPLQSNGGGPSLQEQARLRDLARRSPPVQMQQLVARTSLGEAETISITRHRDITPAPHHRSQRAPRGVIDGFLKICQRWQLSEDAQITLLGYGGNYFLGREILSGWLAAPQDVKDRAGYIVGISLGLGAVFNNSLDAELAWLRRSSSKFGNRSALSIMLDGRMKDLMIVAAAVARERGL
jgi:hypothetical protein